MTGDGGITSVKIWDVSRTGGGEWAVLDVPADVMPDNASLIVTNLDGTVSTIDIETGERRWNHLQRDEWSIHFNVTKDEKLFCGDGGDPGQVAKAKDGQWIYLFRPDAIPNRGNEDTRFVKPGVLRSERLVNMAKHNYRLEPNVSFSPDEKWVIFRSNMLGPTYTFAVEVEKAK